MKIALSFILVAAFAVTAHAKVQSKVVEYKEGNDTFEGYVAWDDAIKGARPGILVIHAWKGLDDNARKRADMLAGLGYVAFAADIYGKGIRPKNGDEAKVEAGKYKTNRKLYRDHLELAYATLLKQPNVDAAKTAAIGFCFGGTGVLELARSGSKVGGVVSFHGGLDSPTPADGKNIKTKILVLHGASDSGSSPADIAAMQKEFTDAKVDWQMVAYGGAVHCFTDQTAGTDASKGCAYDPAADARSWAAMRSFFDELFGKKK